MSLRGAREVSSTQRVLKRAACRLYTDGLLGGYHFPNDLLALRPSLEAELHVRRLFDFGLPVEALIQTASYPFSYAVRA